MKTTVVRYKLKKGQTAENRAFVEAVFDELHESKPDGLRYVSFQLEDGLTFVHVAVVEGENGTNPLPQTESFGKFTANLRDRCEEPPVAMSADIVGSYRLFWERDSTDS